MGLYPRDIHPGDIPVPGGDIPASGGLFPVIDLPCSPMLFPTGFTWVCGQF